MRVCVCVCGHTPQGNTWYLGEPHVIVCLFLQACERLCVSEAGEDALPPDVLTSCQLVIVSEVRRSFVEDGQTALAHFKKNRKTTKTPASFGNLTAPESHWNKEGMHQLPNLASLFI